MAGDWIKMRTNLWDDPRVSQICCNLDCGEAVVIGSLYRLWSMADDHSADGTLVGMTAAALDRKVGVDGFANAVEKTGWLSITDGSVTVLRFEEHNGNSAKRRALDSRRKGRVRKVSASHADKTRTPCGRNAELEETREDERRVKEDSLSASADEVDSPEPPKDDLLILESEFVSKWNTTPGVRTNRGDRLTDKRRRAFRTRVRDPSWDWLAALTHFPLKCFGGDGWKPDIEWFLKPDSVTKIIEGKYDWSKADGRTGTQIGAGQRYDPRAGEKDPEHGQF